MTSFFILSAALFSTPVDETRVHLGGFDGVAQTGSACSDAERDADHDAYERATEQAWTAAQTVAGTLGCGHLTVIGGTVEHSRQADESGTDCVERFRAHFSCLLPPVTVVSQH